MTEKKSVLKGTKAKAKESPKKKIEALPVAPSLTSSLPIAPSLTQINTAPISTPLAIATSLSTSTAIPVTITKPVGAPTGRKSAPTVADIILDPITQIASQHWGPDFEVSYLPLKKIDILIYSLWNIIRVIHIFKFLCHVNYS